MNLRYLIFLIFILQIILISEVRYVSKKGASTPPYISWETACDSIQKCIDYCSSGDTIYIDRGIYKETVSTRYKDLTFIGVDSDECIIDGTGILGKVVPYTLCYFVYGNISLNNLTLIKRRLDEYVFYQAIRSREGDLYLRNCIIDSTAYSLSLAHNTKIENCIVKNAEMAIEVESTDDWEYKIFNNLFYITNSNYSYHVLFNGPGGGKYKIFNNIMIREQTTQGSYAISLETNYRVEIRNNLIAHFRGGMLIWCRLGIPDTLFVENNTFYNDYIMGIRTGGKLTTQAVIRNNITAYGKWGIYSGLGTLSDHNIYYKIWQSPYYQNTPGEHDIIADPMFVNDTIVTLSSNYDVRLQKYSPAIDSGDPAVLDVDGSRSDMGMFGGPGGMRTDYLDLPPKQIKTITADYIPDSSKINLVWEKRWEADFKEYRLYKDVSPNFTIAPKYLIASLTDSVYTDYLTKGSQELYYKVTAVDSTGNESIPSAEVNVTLTDVNEADIKLNYNYELYQNYPNPFNPSTTISYNLKEQGDVRVKLYNITGQLLQTIIEGERDKGYNETKIDLSNYASGIYLYRLEVTGKGKIPVFNDLKKMVYVK